MSQTPNTAIAVIGIDIGKNSFHACWLMRPSFAASRSRRPLQSNLSKPEPATKSP
jgi:hypothetical protein